MDMSKLCIHILIADRTRIRDYTRMLSSECHKHDSELFFDAPYWCWPGSLQPENVKDTRSKHEIPSLARKQSHSNPLNACPQWWTLMLFMMGSASWLLMHVVECRVSRPLYRQKSEPRLKYLSLPKHESFGWFVSHLKRSSEGCFQTRLEK